MSEQMIYGWLRAIDEALVTAHIGVAEPTDDYETAKRKLNSLLVHAQSVGEFFAKDEAQAERDRLKAERDALRADAERYRWLRDENWDSISHRNVWSALEQCPETAGDLDFAIDYALKDTTA
jgi:hypothetical protein